MTDSIFLDNAATTRTDPEVLAAMEPYNQEKFGSPATLYALGSEAKQGIETARQHMADLIGADAKEIFFTSGATESNNWAIKGVTGSLASKGKHIITNEAEHHSILMPCRFLEKNGWEVTFLPVDGDGLVDPEEVIKAIRDDTVLITMVHGNHEIGTIQPIAEIGAAARARKVPFHVNAAQTVGHIPVDVNDLSCDLVTVSGHKFHGPKGVGALYMRRGIRITPLLHGGGQERKRRAGTHNVPGIVGLGKASELARGRLEKEPGRISEIRDYIIDSIENNMDDVRLNGHRSQRLPNNVNFSFEGIEGESIMLSLSYPTSKDKKPIYVSTGSACVSGTLEPSHILLALGVPVELAHGSVRASLSRDNTREDADSFLTALYEVVERLRSMSPVYKRGSKKCSSGSGSDGCDCEAAT